MDIKKLRRKKFIRNVAIGFIALGLVSMLLNIAPGYRRDKFIDVTNLVFHEENVTEDLLHNIYITEFEEIYLSKKDIENLFDSKIDYNEKYSIVKITSDTISSTIVVDCILKEDILYMPILAMEEVYNVSVTYVSETDIVVIDNLNRGLIMAEVRENVVLKLRPRALSRNVSELIEGERVSCFYTTSGGWRQIRRENGEIRICKSK
jgi:hypothetical protein